MENCSNVFLMNRFSGSLLAFDFYLRFSKIGLSNILFISILCPVRNLS